MHKDHISVLVTETIKALRVSPGKKYIDATVGLGGHTSEIVKRGGTVLGVDRDSEALLQAGAVFKTLHIEDQVILRHGSFNNIDQIAKEAGFTEVDGILFDLGFSSWQIDKSGRGFTFQKDETLDMRFDRTEETQSAMEIVNKSSKEELEEILVKFGEEEKARTIAQSIVRYRPITTTAGLAEAIAHAIGSGDKLHHVSRVFQAIRISVNNELTHIKTALPISLKLLKHNGCLAVISFHSLEDRIVKQFFKSEAEHNTIMAKNKPVTATFAERQKNSRSRSAKLRFAYKL